MARNKQGTLDEALALLATGKSFRECEKETRIPKSIIDREAKKLGIIKGSAGHLIDDKVKIEAEIGTLSVPLRDIINLEVKRQLDGMDFYQSQARKVVKLGIEALKQSPSESGMKTVLDGMKSGMQVEGLVPFYPNSTINNVNAQQNVTEKPRTIEDFYGES
jgi:hypothetical protein